MEEELEHEFYNDTTLSDADYDYVPSIYYLLHHIFTILFSFIGVFADCIIIYTIAKSKILHTKTYILFANFCINDVLFLLIFPIGSSLYLIDSRCLHRGTIMLVINCLAVIFILLINPVMNKESITTKRILQTLYIPTLSIAFTRSLLCYIHFDLRNLEFSIVIVYALVFITIIIFEIITFCKRHTSIVDEDYTFRFNICRIYTYNVFILIMVLVSTSILSNLYHTLIDFFILSYLLNGFYMLLYAFYKNKKFNMALMSIIRRDNYKIDAGLNSQNGVVDEENA